MAHPELENRAVRVRLRSPRALVREAVIIVSVYVVYSIIRNLAPSRDALAVRHGWDGLTIERHLGIDVERGINAFVAGRPWLAVPANYFYATLFLPAVVATLAWLWARRPQVYTQFRTVLVVMTLFALASYWLYPLAPPRLLPGGGFIDTVPYFHTWGMDPSDPPKGVSNQFAAMPSMHFGWALWVGTTLWRCASRVWQRVVGVVYPTLTLLVIIATANHYVLDAVGGVVAFLLAVVLVRRVAPRRVTEPYPQAALRG